MKTFKLSGVKYWGPKEKRFEKYKHFQIYDYKDVVTAFLKTSNDLKPNHEKYGWNERPIDSNIDNIDTTKSWSGYDPVYFNIDPTGEKVVMAKADTISMDMRNIGKTWKYFIHFNLPYNIINNYMTNMHDNDNVSIVREYIKAVESSELGWKLDKDPDKHNWKKIEKKFDKKYPEMSSYKDFYETHEVIKWKQDFDIRQYISIHNNGLLFPVVYDSTNFILKRGTHRAVLLAMTKSDIPVFLQWPFMDKHKNDKDSYEINTPNFFGGNSLKIIVKPREEILDFYISELSKDKFIGRLQV